MYSLNPGHFGQLIKEEQPQMLKMLTHSISVRLHCFKSIVGAEHLRLHLIRLKLNKQIILQKMQTSRDSFLNTRLLFLKVRIKDDT